MNNPASKSARTAVKLKKRRTISRTFLRITLLFLPILPLSGCNSLPPSSPVANNEQWFDPRYLTWQPVEEAEILTHNWYKNGNTFLGMGEDVLRVDNNYFNDWSLEEAQNYYRLTFKLGGSYLAMYLSKVSDDTLRFVYANTPAENQQDFADIPASGSWQYLTSMVFWTPLPDEEPENFGNWHKSDNMLEIAFRPGEIELDGKIWNYDAVLGNAIYRKVILSREDSVITMYYTHYDPKNLLVLFQDGDSENRDIHGKLTGDWSTLIRWYDFLELSGWKDGASFRYDYELNSLHSELTEIFDPPSGLRDSVIVRRQMLGEMRCDLNGTITGNGQGELGLDVTYNFTEINGRQQVIRITQTNVGQNLERLSDSTWTQSATVPQAHYRIFMENDTLWLDRPRGKELFCPRRIDFNSRLNLSVFAYPFNPPLDGFPDTLGYLAPVAGPGSSPPQPEFFVPDNSVPATGNWVGIQAELIPIAAGKQYGIARNSYSVLSEDAGMPVIQYVLGDYDRRWWFPSNYPQRPFPPHVDEYVFTCVQKH